MIARHRRAAAFVGGALLLLPLQAAHGALTRTHARAVSRAARIDPRAVGALRNMSGYLRTLTSFEIRVATSREEFDARGRKARFTGTIDYQVRRPNGLTIRSNEAGRRRELVYDGKTLTVFTPNTGYFASVAAPPTIRQTLALAADRYDIHPPLVDLFKWGEGENDERQLTAARVLGPSQVDGLPATEYEFARKGVGYRIWIEQGPEPLPLRITLTGKSQPERLTFNANLAWNTNARFAQNTFAFRPPAGSRQIAIANS